MNLNFLECFLTLSESLSFTATARALGITQPSVSRQIRLLEESLRTPLFLRDRHRVRLTREGRELKSRLAPLMDQVRRTLTQSAESSRLVEGPLSFACLPEIGQYFFMEILLAFEQAHPGIDLHTQFMLEPEMVELLKAGKVDFVVLSQALISENIRSYRLIDERSVLVTRSSNKDDLTDIRRAHFVGYDRSDALLGAFLKKYYRYSEISRIARISTVNSHRSLIETLLSRDCYAVLPVFSVEDQIRRRELRRVSDREIRQTFYLVHLETANPAEKYLVFRKHLVDRCRRAGETVV